MFKLGQCTGVQPSCSCCEGKTVPDINTYLNKMSKTAKRLPCPQIAKAKTIEVVKGVSTVVKSSISACNGSKASCCSGSCSGKSCCGGSSKSNNTSCCGGRASPCGGGKSSRGGATSSPDANPNGQAQSLVPGQRVTPAGQPVTGGVAVSPNDQAQTDATEDQIVTTDDPEADLSVEAITAATSELIVDVLAPIPAVAVDALNHEYLHDGLSPFATHVDPRTGIPLTELLVPSDLADITESNVGFLYDQNRMSAAEFKRTYCDNRPYPECDTCQWAQQVMDITPIDLYRMVQMIREGIDALVAGNIGWAENIFNCPGQLAAMLQNTLGPLGNLIGSVAANAVIGLTAVRGALYAYENAAMAFAGSDYRAFLIDAMAPAFMSGGSRGDYPTVMNEIADILGVTPMDFIIAGSSPEGLRRISTHRRRRIGRRIPSVAAVAAAAAAGPVIGAIADLTINALLEPRSPNAGGSDFEPRVPVEPAEVPAVPVAGSVPHDQAIDTRMDPEVPPTTARGDQTYVKDSPETNTTYVLTQDKIVDGNKIYYYHDAEGWHAEPNLVPGTSFMFETRDYFEEITWEAPAKEEIPVVPGETNLTSVDPAGWVYVRGPIRSEDPPMYQVWPGAIEGNLRFFEVVLVPYEDEITGRIDFVENYSPITREQAEKYKEEGKPIYVYNPPASSDVAKGATVAAVTSALEAGTPIVFSDGLEYVPPCFTDHGAYTEVIQTPKLVTATGILAADMVKVKGIGLTVDELKIAYMIDAEINGSKPPEDVRGEVIPTILDRIGDTEY